MKTPKTFAAVLSVAVVVTACGSDQAETTTTRPLQATTTTVATTTTAPPDTTTTTAAERDAVPWSMEAAGPGTFASTRFIAPFTFVLSDGWLPIFPEGEEILNMRLPERAVLFVVENEADSVETVLANVERQAGVDLQNTTDVEVGGVSGVRFEAVGDGVLRFRSATSGSEHPLQDEAVRVTVVAVSDTVVVMVEVTPIDDPDGARPETLAIIDSIMWGAG